MLLIISCISETLKMHKIFLLAVVMLIIFSFNCNMYPYFLILWFQNVI